MGTRDQLLPSIARVSPDILIRASLLYPTKKRQQDSLALWLKGIAAKQRQPINVIWPEKLQYMIFRFFTKGLSIVKSPSFWLETAGAAISAARYEKADPDTQTVCNIAVFNCTVIHSL